MAMVYLSHGVRRYDVKPIPPDPRRAWEFEAVVSGSIQPVIPGARTSASPRRLWVFPPGSPHGWTGPGGREARIVVAHFNRVPDELAAIAADAPMTTVAIDAAEARRLERAVVALAASRRRPTIASTLRAERLLLDLTLLVIDRLGVDRPVRDANARIVNQALGWYAAHMSDRPTVDDMAREVGCSSSQLRRIFAAAGSVPPLAAMRRLQAERADGLLRHGDLSLGEIARSCGYGSPSAFSRGFRAVRGRPPSSVQRLSPPSASGTIPA